MNGLAGNELALKLFPELTAEALKERFAAYDSIRTFQGDVMYRGCRFMMAQTMETFTCSGQEYLDGKPCLFISNHRDIVVDSMMLQYQLITLGLDTTYLVVGSNLYEMPLMAQLAKVNKMIGIARGGGRKAYYRSLMELSTVLRQIVVSEGHSAWIAQRNGRTKDGCDQTDPALVKMIAATGDDPVKGLVSMNIVPLSISYEWEPCAAQKAREVCLRRKGPYEKVPGEDSQSIINGIMDFKGKVHLSVCKPLEPSEIEATKGVPAAVAALIDSRIAEGYRLFDTNRMAAALLKGEPLPESQESERFVKYLEKTCEKYPLGPEYRQTLLEIYANPILKKVNYHTSQR